MTRIGDDYVAYGKKGNVFAQSEENTTEVKKEQKSNVTVPMTQNTKKDDKKGIALEHKEEPKQVQTRLEENRKFVNKQYEENRIAEVKRQYLAFGVEGEDQKLTENEAEKYAKEYVKREKNIENAKTTRSFINKDEYKAAEKAREKEKDELVKQFRKEGLSKKEAKQKAESMLIQNAYMKRAGRKYVEAHKDDFYENGKFSNEKAKNFAKNLVNTHTENNEVEDGHLSLKEQYDIEKNKDIKKQVQRCLVRAEGYTAEHNNTNLYKGGVILGSALIGAGVGSTLSTTTTSLALSSSGTGAATGCASAGATGSAVAAAKVTTDLTAAGAVTGFGLGVGAATIVQDKGRKEVHLNKPGELKIQVEVPPEPKHTIPTIKPDRIKICPEEKWKEDFCDYKVKKGEYWDIIVRSKYTHADGTKITDEKEIKNIIHALKIRHGITNFKQNTQPEVMRLYTELNGKQYKVNCDGKVYGKMNSDPNTNYKKWNGKYDDLNEYKQDCNDDKPVLINKRKVA